MDEYEKEIKDDENMDGKGILGGMNKKSSKEEEEELKKKLKDELEKEISDGEIEKKHSKQLGGILMIMVGIFLTITIMILVIHAVNNFEYKGVDFEKTKFGEIPIYKFSLNFVESYSPITGKVTYSTRDFALRNDPRKMDFPMYIDRIFFTEGVNYVSLDPALTDCEDSGIAIANLAGFLGAAGVNVKGATGDLNSSIEGGIPYATCSAENNETVISVEIADKTSIVQEGLCYRISVVDCEVLGATEQFMIEVASSFIEA